MKDERVDAVVLGAGVAGLEAARRLVQWGKRVVVLEARARLGGRVETVPDAQEGTPLELGAEFLHGRSRALLALAEEAGLSVRPVEDTHRVRWRGRLVDAAGDFDFLAQVAHFGGRDVTAAAWLQRRAQQEGWSERKQQLAWDYVRGFYAAPARVAGMEALARMERAGAALGGVTPSRVLEGYGRLVDVLAAPVRPRVRLGHTVQEVRWRPGQVEVRGEGFCVRARHAVVTLPLGVLQEGGVRFSPGLEAKRQALGTLRMGAIVKVLLRLSEAFWRSTPQLEGLGFVHTPGQPLPVWWTLAPLRSRWLVGWAGGPAAEALAGLDEEALVARAACGLAAGLGVTPAAVAEAVEARHVRDWRADPLARGGYCVVPAGAAELQRALARPVEDTLFFAGEATHADGFTGTVHGALATGTRAAWEVLTAEA